jgi:hypothetical protein
MRGILASLMAAVAACAGLAAEEASLQELFAAGKYREGKELALKQLADQPDDGGLLFNGGLAAYLSGDFKTAIALWQRLKLAEDADPKLRAKLVQAFEADGASADCAREIAELHALFRKEPALFKDTTFFVRDQFVVKGQRVMVFEYFTLQGERPLKYKFNLIAADGGVERTVSLGSYPGTNEVMQIERKLPDGERYYHLDGYEDGGANHRTYGFYAGAPAYAEVKRAVIEALSGERRPVSGTDAR